MAADLAQVETAQIEEYYSYFQTVKKDIVKPARIHHDPSRLYLSNLDIFHPAKSTYVQILFAYRLSDTSDTLYNQFVLGLKQSLAKVLVSFYPAAGVLVRTCDMHHPVVLVCDDRGVPFIEAYKDEQMEEILKNHERVIPLSGLQAVGIVSNRQIQEIPESGIPGVVVQITRFNCGGVSITFSWNHVLADMAGAMLLIKAWADIAGKGETTVVPHIDRTVLSPIRANKTEPKIEVERKIEVQKTEVSLSSPANNVAQVGIVRSPDMVGTKVLHISKDKIGMVKQAALDYGYVVSTLDCISAHLWRSVTRHGNAFRGTDSTCRSLITAVDGRERLRGTLTSNYFGNVVLFASVRDIPTTEILSRPLAYTASLIRKAIQEITEESYWEMIDKVEKVKQVTTRSRSMGNHLSALSVNLLVTSWIRFGMYDVDFGSGKPLHLQTERLQSMEPAIDQAVCVILPSNPSVGSFDVVISWGSSLLQRLWTDPEFTSLS